MMMMMMMMMMMILQNKAEYKQWPNANGPKFHFHQQTPKSLFPESNQSACVSSDGQTPVHATMASPALLLHRCTPKLRKHQQEAACYTETSEQSHSTLDNNFMANTVKYTEVMTIC